MVHSSKENLYHFPILKNTSIVIKSLHPLDIKEEIGSENMKRLKRRIIAKSHRRLLFQRTQR